MIEIIILGIIDSPHDQTIKKNVRKIVSDRAKTLDLSLKDLIPTKSGHTLA